jgi:hypothetical protein
VHIDGVNAQDMMQVPAAGKLRAAMDELGQVPLPFLAPGILHWVAEGRPQQEPLVERWGRGVS